MDGPPIDAESEALAGALAALGMAVERLVPIAGDASVRRYFRAVGVDGRTAVAAVYPPDAAAQAARDAAVQRWGRERGLPIPRLLAAAGRMVVSEDLGARGLGAALAEGREAVLRLALEALDGFRRAAWQGGPNPAFDAAFFRRELAGFEEHFVPAADRGGAVGEFLDALARRLCVHPYRLVHRDFHVDNLFLRGGSVWAVDFQDMRGGPDTYDATSLLCERAAAEFVTAPEPWFAAAAEVLGWEPGWPERVCECRAQRGLKVLGTFRRLARAGRPEYLRFVPPVQRGLAPVLAALAAPPALLRAVARGGGDSAL